MYINPFVGGIITTILVELILVYGYAIYAGLKKRGE